MEFKVKQNGQWSESRFWCDNPDCEVCSQGSQGIDVNITEEPIIHDDGFDFCSKRCQQDCNDWLKADGQFVDISNTLKTS